MQNFVRTVLSAGFVATAIAFGAADLSGQELAASEAQAFLGSWSVAINAEGQTFVMDVAIEDEQGSVAAEVASELGTSRVERVSRSGENLVLRYSFNYQGQAVPVTMTLAPAADGLNANVDFADGMYVTTGKGTRK